VEFFPFELERWQSTWEHRVRFNLSESGVHPLSLSELLEITQTDPEELGRVRFGYSQGNGSDELRDAIATLYSGATRENVLVTVGGAEANFVACWALVKPGEKVAVFYPTYLQTWGLARNAGAELVPIRLHPEKTWQADPEEIRERITPDTRLVVVTNPQNPSGQILSDTVREAVLERVRETGAWLFVDEIYQGAELDGATTPSWWGRYERLLITNGLSKAYGLPGLRIGWIVGPREMIEHLWRRHDYTVIGPSPVSDFLAWRALAHRERILARTRRILNTNYPVLERWLRGFGDLFSWHPPSAGAICFVRLGDGVDTLELVEAVRREHSILLVPGEHFGMPGYLRIGYGNPTEELEQALAELSGPFRQLKAA
jgi:aspartate/methionine/tyrosine aminotransferase